MPAPRRQRTPLPDRLTPGAREFHLELRRLTDQAGLTSRTLEQATSSSGTGPGGNSDFFSKSSWNRWLNAEGQHPPRKAVKRLTERLAADQLPAEHLLGLWDRAFAPGPAALVTAFTTTPAKEQSDAASGPRTVATVTDTIGGSVLPGQPVLDDDDWSARASDHLASLVARECADVLAGWLPPGRETLAVGWRADPQADLGPGSDPGGLGPAAGHLRHGGRLAVLGPGGAGKSTLALMLMEQLLAARQTGDPVPVLFPASSLASGEMIRSWIARVLADRYPSLLDSRAYGPDAPADLAARFRVLPVIDSLDDLPAGQRSALLRALPRALGPNQPLVITSRPEEYRAAVADIGRVPIGISVVSLEPVTASETARFLERGAIGPAAPRWRLIASEIRAQPDSPLARTLSSPLMATLMRSAYADRADAAAALADYGDAAAIADQILDALVATRFTEHAASEQERPRQPVRADDAHRWLSFLAAHLAREHSYDLTWPRLRHAFPAFSTPLRWAVFTGALAWLVAGLVFAASHALATGTGSGALTGVLQGADAAFLTGPIYLVSRFSYPPGTPVAPWLHWLRWQTRTPLRMAAILPAAYGLESGLRDGIIFGLPGGAVHAITLSLTSAVLNWLVAAAIFFLAVRARLVLMTDNPAYFSLRVPGRGLACAKAVSAGLLWGAALGLAMGAGVEILSSTLAHEHPRWLLGIPTGAVLGGTFAIAQWGRTPDQSAPPASPASVLRADRSLVLLLTTVSLVALPALYTAALATGGGIRSIAQVGLEGLGIGLVLWLATVLSHAWPQYLITTAWLAARGRLPWRLASFLAQTHDLQILRQRGATYQFRHARLQDRLADLKPRK